MHPSSWRRRQATRAHYIPPMSSTEKSLHLRGLEDAPALTLPEKPRKPRVGSSVMISFAAAQRRAVVAALRSLLTVAAASPLAFRANPSSTRWSIEPLRGKAKGEHALNLACASFHVLAMAIRGALAMGEALADIREVVLPECAEPGAEGLEASALVFPFLSRSPRARRSATIREASPTVRGASWRAGSRFKGEYPLEAPPPLLGGRDAVAHPFGDEEQRLIAVRGPE